MKQCDSAEATSQPAPVPDPMLVLRWIGGPFAGLELIGMYREEQHQLRQLLGDPAPNVPSTYDRRPKGVSS